MWRLVHKMMHNTLNIKTAVAYIPYQDLENKNMMLGLLERPDEFVSHLSKLSCAPRIVPAKPECFVTKAAPSVLSLLLPTGCPGTGSNVYVGRYTSSLTTQMVYGFRTISNEDPRMLQFFRVGFSAASPALTFGFMLIWNKGLREMG